MRLKRIVTRSARRRVSRFPAVSGASYNVPLGLPNTQRCIVSTATGQRCKRKVWDSNYTPSGHCWQHLRLHDQRLMLAAMYIPT